MGSRLETVIARNVAALRAEREMTQSDLAKVMRRLGCTTTTNRVTQIETLRRPAALLEVICLALALDVPASRLLEGDDEIALSKDTEAPLYVLRSALTGVGTEQLRGFQISQTHLGAVFDQARKSRETDADDLRKMASRLGLDSPSDLDALARLVFGQSFQDERGKRIGDVSGLSKRSAQTMRGHVSRALLADIRNYLGEGQQRLDRLKELHAKRDAIQNHLAEGQQRLDRLKEVHAKRDATEDEER
jgi:transcriptional regulator with XRE-family HTH domain